MAKVTQISNAELAEIDNLIGLPSKDMAFGGPYDAANRFDRTIAGWAPPLQSADGEILPDKDLLDARSRDMFRNDAYVQSGATQHKDSIVGDAYLPNAKPMTSVLGKGFDDMWAQEFQQEVEELFMLVAESPANWLDAARQNDFTSMIRLGVGTYTYTGEILGTAEWMRGNREFNTAIQMVDTDRLRTPPSETNNPRVRGGIRHDARGRHLSYFIRVTHPTDYRNLVLAENGTYFREVKAEKPWGRKQVIFVREQNRVDQTRAISDIVSGLKELAITRKFRDVTLQNAVVNAMYAATIESELPAEAVYTQLGGNNLGDGVVSYAEALLSAMSEYVNSAQHMKIDGVKVPHLFPGTKLQLRPAGTPGGVGQDFETSLLRYLASSLNLSYEELSRDFSKTNYSSARAGMSLTWKFQRARKKFVADKMANAVYRLFVEEAIQKNRLSTFPASKAGTLYTNGYLNLRFDALTTCDWIGASRGQIDELKETQAAVLKIKWGLSTHEDELARLGKDWRKVYAQLEREAAERESRSITLIEDNSVNAASGSPRDQSGQSQDPAAIAPWGEQQEDA